MDQFTRISGSLFCRKVLSVLVSCFLFVSAHTTLADEGQEGADFGRDLIFTSDSVSPDDHMGDKSLQYILTKIIVEPQGNLEHQLVLVLNDNTNIDSVIRRSAKEFLEFKVNDLRKGDVILAVSQGKNAVLLTCPNCTETTGGLLTMKYLYNGIMNSYKTINFNLIRNGASWSLISENGQIKIHTLKLHSRTVLGQVIGIDNVSINN